MCSKFCNQLGLNKSIIDADNDDDIVRLNCSSGYITTSVHSATQGQKAKPRKMSEASSNARRTEDQSPAPMVQEGDFIDPGSKEDEATSRELVNQGPGPTPTITVREATTSSFTQTPPPQVDNFLEELVRRRVKGPHGPPTMSWGPDGKLKVSVTIPKTKPCVATVVEEANNSCSESLRSHGLSREK